MSHGLHPFAPGTSFYMPEIMTRILARSHPNTVEIEEQSAVWVRRHLCFAFSTEQDLERFLGTRSAYFACLIWPMTRDDWMLDLANLAQHLFAFVDAYGDRAGIGRDTRSAWKVFDDFFAVMAGQPPQSGHPYAINFQDLWVRIALPMTASQRDRYRRASEDWLNDCAREIASRAEGVVFDFDTYLAVRRGSVYATPCYPIIEHSLGIELPPDLAASNELEQLHLLVTDCMLLINDLYSFPKEARQGDLVNAVSILCIHHGLELQHAVDRVCELLHESESMFLANSRTLLVRHPELQQSLRPYLEALGYYMSGLLYWARLTSRYHGPGYVWNGLTSGIVTLGDTGTSIRPAQGQTRAAHDNRTIPL